MSNRTEIYRTTDNQGRTVIGFKGYEVIVQEDGSMLLLVLSR